jgi:hypothetical protein
MQIRVIILNVFAGFGPTEAFYGGNIVKLFFVVTKATDE